MAKTAKKYNDSRNGLAKVKSSNDKMESPGLFSFVAEPALLLHMLTSVMVFMNIQDFLVEKACLVNLGYSEEVCTALRLREGTERFEEEEKQVQKLTGQVMMWRMILENVFPMFLVLLVGSFSDKYGRKLPMLFVLIGFIAQNIALIFCVYFKTGTGAWTVALVSSILPGLFGNQACFGMSVFSYVADTSSVEKRTMRTGIAHTFFFAGLTFGLAAGGILSKSGLNFTQIFGIGLVMEALIFVYVWVVVKNIRDEKAVKGKSTSDMVKDLFDFQHVKDAVGTVTKKRPGNTRKMLFFLLLSHSLLMAPMMGEMGVMYLFTRLKFNWDSGNLGTFMTYRTVLGFFGNFISMGLLTQVLKLTDPAVGIAAATSALLSNLLFITANTTTMMFICPIVAILSSATMIVPRSIISKIIPSNETGKINAFIASLESITPLLSGPIYTVLYTKTFEVFPESFFLLSAVLAVPPILVFWWIINSSKKESKKE